MHRSVSFSLNAAISVSPSLLSFSLFCYHSFSCAFLPRSLIGCLAPLCPIHRPLSPPPYLSTKSPVFLTSPLLHPCPHPACHPSRRLSAVQHHAVRRPASVSPAVPSLPAPPPRHHRYTPPDAPNTFANDAEQGERREELSVVLFTYTQVNAGRRKGDDVIYRRPLTLLTAKWRLEKWKTG